MMDYTVLNGLMVSVRHLTLPEGVTPGLAHVEGTHPLGMLWTGSEFVEYVPTPPPITSITPRQARLALLGAGLLDTVRGAFTQLPEPQRTAAQIEWDHALSIERSSPLVAQMAAAAGLSEEQVDELFAAGAAL
jgi:hypothetical protein